MKLISFQKVKDGKYLKNYELKYLNKAGREKTYEIVSRRELNSEEELGKCPSGVSIVATKGDQFLLLKEFRMGVNQEIYNLCAGMTEEGESIEACIHRELFEETGLRVKEIKQILPPSFAAVAISDITTHLAFVEVEGDINLHHASENEQIQAAFYDRETLLRMIREGAPFSSRAQVTAYFFCMNH
ncbi:MAG: NUDIX hydrolase [Lachnospiraceae bacterium]|nr:NUDIX hydrolase [Lachnospiraceae bacterium]